METIAKVEIPSNSTINKNLNEAENALEETRVEQKKNLTREGRQIIDQTEKLIADTKTLVNERNPNDTLQEIIKEAKKFYEDTQTNRLKWMELYKIVQNPKGELKVDDIKKQMESMARTARLFAVELVSSAKFRQSIYDLFSVLYTILIDASQIEKVGKPLREAMENIESYKTIEQNFEDSKDKLKEAGEKAINLGLDYMDKDKPVPKLTDEQKKQLWGRLREIINEFSERERGQRLIHGLFEIFDMFATSFKRLQEKATATAEQLANDEHIKNICDLTKQLFESFTQVSLDPLCAQVQAIYTSAWQDENFKGQILAFREWLFKALEKPEILAKDETYDEFMKLVDDINKSVADKAELKPAFNTLNYEFNKIIWVMENDPLTQNLKADIQSLVKTIFLDDRGHISFKPEVLDQLKLILLSSLVTRIKVPLPEVCVCDPDADIDFKVNGLALGVQDILPERLIAENQGIAILNIKDKTAEKSDLTKKADYFEPTVAKAAEAVRIKMENINVHMPDADIWFHKKTFPQVTDSGRADIDIGGKGLDLTFILKANIGSDKLFTLASVTCDIHELKLKLHDTKHDTVYNMFVNVFKPSIKRQVEESIQERMATVFDSLNEQISLQVANLKKTVATIPDMIAHQ